jgi:predicted house-cleaning noncanonical NTP pyrophosphatase (MazG superfamily)
MPNMTTYNKLVRDRIPENLDAKGIVQQSRVANTDEYWNKLKEKLMEEVIEFFDAENVEELADITEVLYAICRHKKFDKEDLIRVRLDKRKEKGGFDKRTILIEAEEKKRD